MTYAREKVSRVLRRIVPALLAGLTLLTACSTATGPQVGSGVAAVVGDQVISSELIAQRLRTAAPQIGEALAQQAQEQGRPDHGHRRRPPSPTRAASC